ncbi:MAG: LuxR family transcriptional regulator [Ferruginibacter sp.]|nr:LuxR family transcriptional regulator [Ferruginibacter sp.]
MGKPTIHIVLGDDHEIFRNGFKTLFDDQPGIRFVGEAANGDELLRVIAKLKPEIVFTDIKMPGMNGVETTRLIRKRYPFAEVIALSTFNDAHFLMDMLDAGAKGYLLKDASKREVLEAIHAVHAQTHYYCKATREKMTELRTASGDSLAELKRIAFSGREKEIIGLICGGMSTMDIAKKLFLSKRTVDGHRDRIMRKASAPNIASLVTFAIRHGLFEV